MISFRKTCILFSVAISSAEGFVGTVNTARAPAVTVLAAANNHNDSVGDSSRRIMFGNAGAFAAALAFAPVVAANALDMDAFANAQVRTSTGTLLFGVFRD